MSIFLTTAVLAATLDPSCNTATAEMVDEPTPDCCLLGGRAAMLAAASASAISVEQRGERVSVAIAGSPFAEYRADNPHQPAVWPIDNAAGASMTRSFPLGELLEGEVDDHPHHQSLWFAHGDVNGHDFWHLPPEETSETPRIVHTGYECLEPGVVGAKPAMIVTTNEWRVGRRPVLTDRRELRFGADANSASAVRWIDFTIVLQASEGPVAFGDTKEGAFALRVPGPMKIDAGLGGRIVNAAGEADQAAWGATCEWVAYSGPISPAGERTTSDATLVIMNHPDSAGGDCRWHVRGYGLFAANPFGESDFGGARERPRRLPAGESLEFRYRVAISSVPLSSASTQALYNAFRSTALRAASND